MDCTDMWLSLSFRMGHDRLSNLMVIDTLLSGYDRRATPTNKIGKFVRSAHKRGKRKGVGWLINDSSLFPPASDTSAAIFQVQHSKVPFVIHSGACARIWKVTLPTPRKRRLDAWEGEGRRQPSHQSNTKTLKTLFLRSTKAHEAPVEHFTQCVPTL